MHPFSANSQAFLKEYHTKMLRKHLQRLEQHPGGEDRYESTDALSPIQEDEAEHDGMPLSFNWVILICARAGSSK